MPIDIKPYFMCHILLINDLIDINIADDNGSFALIDSSTQMEN